MIEDENDDDTLEIFDDLESVKKALKKRTVNVAESGGYSEFHGIYKNKSGETLTIHDDGSWQSGEAKGEDFQLLNVFLTLGKDKYLSL